MTLMQSTAKNEQSARTLSNVMQLLNEFVGAAPQHDDIRLLILRRK